ncbi:MAG: aminotransferase class V-fold PLP-dependent enzyme, partial [Phycisphaerae bacterium]|nr:aminotransferase class V-fold PLP-dependent enzyme [Phycisphaerae bacterium]
MSNRVFNFSAGPAMLPTEVLEKSAAALLDYQGRGFGIAECSHRGKEFEQVMDEAIALCKELLGLGQSHDVLFLQGGATQLFTQIPMAFLHGSADYLVSGEWSRKAASAAREAGGRVNIVATSEPTGFDRSPPEQEWKLHPDADYFHVCSNETVHGHRLP